MDALSYPSHPKGSVPGKRAEPKMRIICEKSIIVNTGRLIFRLTPFIFCIIKYNINTHMLINNCIKQILIKTILMKKLEINIVNVILVYKCLYKIY